MGHLSQRGKVLRDCLVQDIQLRVVPEDGTTTIISSAPHIQPEDGVQGFPKAIAEVPIDTNLRLEVRGCYHIGLGVKHKPI
jgi:hypothetical protein